MHPLASRAILLAAFVCSCGSSMGSRPGTEFSEVDAREAQIPSESPTRTMEPAQGATLARETGSNAEHHDAESPQQRVERLLREFSGGVDPTKLYYDADLEELLPTLKWEVLEDLIPPDGFLNWDINRDSESPLRCDAEVLRRVSPCSRGLVVMLQKYLRYQKNKYYPPKWTDEETVWVLSFGAGYELKFKGSPLAMSELVYSYYEQRPSAAEKKGNE